MQSFTEKVRENVNEENEQAAPIKPTGLTPPASSKSYRPPDSGGSITREQFLLPEMRKVATMRRDGYVDDEIIDLAKTENIFQYPTTRMTQSIARACLKRLDALAQPQLAALFAEGAGEPDQVAQINLYAMARTYRLVYDFLETEIGPRYLSYDLEFGVPEMNFYFANLTLRSAEVARWSDATFVRLKQELRSCLALTGMLNGPRGTTLQTILLDHTLQEAMQANGDYVLLPAFGCFTAGNADSTDSAPGAGN